MPSLFFHWKLSLMPFPTTNCNPSFVSLSLSLSLHSLYVHSSFLSSRRQLSIPRPSTSLKPVPRTRVSSTCTSQNQRDSRKHQCTVVLQNPPKGGKAAPPPSAPMHAAADAAADSKHGLPPSDPSSGERGGSGKTPENASAETLTDSDAGGELFEYDFVVTVKYVRRELRALTDRDRETFFNAVSVLQRVPSAVGRAVYGEKYYSKDYFNRMHLYYGEAACEKRRRSVLLVLAARPGSFGSSRVMARGVLVVTRNVSSRSRSLDVVVDACVLIPDVDLLPLLPFPAFSFPRRPSPPSPPFPSPLGGARDCDHWHAGAGFVTSHIAITLMYEQALQSINPSIAMPYWDVTIEGTFYDWSDFRTSSVFSDDWFGAGAPSNVSGDRLVGRRTVGRKRSRVVPCCRVAGKQLYRCCCSCCLCLDSFLCGSSSRVLQGSPCFTPHGRKPRFDWEMEPQSRHIAMMPAYRFVVTPSRSLPIQPPLRFRPPFSCVRAPLATPTAAKDARQGEVRLRPRHGQRHRVLAVLQPLRHAAVGLEHGPEPFPDPPRPPPRLREQQETVGLQALPRRLHRRELVRGAQNRESDASVVVYLYLPPCRRVKSCTWPWCCGNLW